MRVLLPLLIAGLCFDMPIPCQSVTYAQSPPWQDLLPTIETEKAVAGQWSIKEKSLTVKASDGARLMLPVAPQGEYDFRVTFTRHTGRDSIAMIFVHGGKQATFEIDAWNQHLAGVQNVRGQDLRSNATRQENRSLKNGRRHTMTVEVRKDSVRCLLDKEELVRHQTDGSDLSMTNFWRLPRANCLGIGVWNSQVTFHSVEVRSVDQSPLKMLAKATSSSNQPTTAPKVSSKAKRNSAADDSSAKMKPKKGRKRVLIVIANQDFFYREYAEPRAELERAGIHVTVAAGTKAACRPHANSGQGNRSGIVQPDITLSQVEVGDYDAVLFSGGWGASCYQYAFPGRYNNRVYNGNPSIKKEANRIVNEFLAADKYTCALCNAVSVLAWARVNGKSPLAGKRVCAPTRAAAAGIYNGRQAQPSCRWHPEVNGARMSPPGSIGRSNTAADDVLVDGKIITGEDDISAREMGRRIVQVLLQ